jgi:hypothetical protein
VVDSLDLRRRAKDVRDASRGEPRLNTLFDEHDLELVRLCIDNGFHALAARWPLPTRAVPGREIKTRQPPR